MAPALPQAPCHPLRGARADPSDPVALSHQEKERPRALFLEACRRQAGQFAQFSAICLPSL
jgi:hypothetical protein